MPEPNAPAQAVVHLRGRDYALPRGPLMALAVWQAALGVDPAATYHHRPSSGPPTTAGAARAMSTLTGPASALPRSAIDSWSSDSTSSGLASRTPQPCYLD